MINGENLRYELKIPLEGLPVYEIKRWINLHSYGFRNSYPPRRVNNIYFDTNDFSDFQDHIDGSFIRKKIRLRWSGEELNCSGSNLEIKSKLGNLGNKSIFFLSTPFNFLNVTFKEIHQKITDKIPKDISFLFSGYHPAIMNYYQREYFESVKSGVRLTIDYDHHTFDQRFSHRPNLNFSEPFLNSPIIEIKAAQDKYKSISEILSKFPANSNRFSKYIDSMSSVLSR